ncbi:hypothetical protein IAT40_005536 [Kwoniella sp. CBS 6097]
MKRSPSSSPSLDSSFHTSDNSTEMSDTPIKHEDHDVKPNISSAPKTPTKNNTKTTKTNGSTKASPSKSPRKPKIEPQGTNATSSPGGSKGTWDGEKKALFMDEIIAAGYKAADLDQLAARIGLSKRQLIDQLVPNRSNLRSKAVKGAKAE